MRNGIKWHHFLIQKQVFASKRRFSKNSFLKNHYENSKKVVKIDENHYENRKKVVKNRRKPYENRKKK